MRRFFQCGIYVHFFFLSRQKSFFKAKFAAKKISINNVYHRPTLLTRGKQNETIYNKIQLKAIPKGEFPSNTAVCANKKEWMCETMDQKSV